VELRDAQRKREMDEFVKGGLFPGLLSEPDKGEGK
jgi:hypothetical protein